MTQRIGRVQLARLNYPNPLQKMDNFTKKSEKKTVCVLFSKKYGQILNRLARQFHQA